VANTLITPTVIARRMLAIMYGNTVLTGLVSRDYDPDFAGKQGDTVNVRTPTVFAANEYNRTTGIVVQNIVETTTPIILDTLYDVSFAVTAEELTLELDEFDERVLVPAQEAIAQAVEEKIADALATVTAGAGAVTGADAKLLVDARTALSDKNVPATGRVAALDPQAAGVLLKDPLIHDADRSGGTAGLREASLGRVFGFDTYEASAIKEVEPAIDGFAFHPSGVVLASRTLERPMGKGPGEAATAAYKGLGLRVVKDYDINKKQDIVSVDFLAGVKILDANRISPLTVTGA
jgi:hypothetical protein